MKSKKKIVKGQFMITQFLIRICLLNFKVSDENYAKIMLGAGNVTPVDEDSNYEMELPEWADHEKIKM